MKKNKRISYFSLLELFAVCSVIMILCSILIPVTISIKKSAKASYCTGTLRYLACANFMFANDHNGRFVSANPRQTEQNQLYWFEESSNQESHSLFPYLANGIQKCPEFTPMKEENSKKISQCGAYGYNRLLGIKNKLNTEDPYAIFQILPQEIGFLSQNIKNPAKTIFFADNASHINPDTAQLYPDESATFNPIINPAENIGKFLSPTIQFRHKSFANSIMTDGHAYPIKPLLSKNQLLYKNIAYQNEPYNTAP